MWIAMNDSFVSAVQDRNDPDVLWVRARHDDDLNAFAQGHPIVRHAGSDYPSRFRLTKAEFARLVTDRIQAISYGNFKSSVPDDDRHDAYLDIWSAMRNFQSAKERSAKRAKGSLTQ